MTCHVDLGDMLEQDMAEVKRIEAIGPKVAQIARAAASTERQSHRYRNRAGRLEGLTRADVFKMGPDGFEIDLHMGAFYGKFVQARGFSDFEHYGDTAESAIDSIVFGK